MSKIVLITVNDSTWALSAWRRAIPVLQRDGHQIAGIWLTDDRLAKHRGIDIPLYYLKTFGVVNFILLAIFAAIVRLSALLHGKEMTLERLAQTHSIPLFRTSSPNEERVVSWLKSNDIDIAIIMTPFIIRLPFINAVKKGVINKHAALLPANKGLFPYFWARLKDEPQALSFHVVNEDIDTGATLWQSRVDDENALSSMISFYAYVFLQYAEGLASAVSALMEGRSIEHESISPSYQGLPAREDYLRFKKKGGRIVAFKDFLLAWRL